VAKGQLDETLTDVIFATPIGETSIVAEVPGDGLYLYQVLAEEMRTPEGSQLEEIKSTAFRDWYTPQKDAATIVRDPAISGLQPA
jgi:hypothetical protein